MFAHSLVGLCLSVYLSFRLSVYLFVFPSIGRPGLLIFRCVIDPISHSCRRMADRIGLASFIFAPRRWRLYDCQIGPEIPKLPMAYGSRWP